MIELNVFELSRRGYELLKMEGNCGRALRRYVGTVVNDQNLVQWFSQYGDDEAFNKNCEVADVIREANAKFLAFPEVKEISPIRDKMTGLAGNAYQLTVAPETATVKQLKRIVSAIVVLSDNLHAHYAKILRDERAQNINSLSA